MNDHELYFACTEESYASTVPEGRFQYIPDASRTDSRFKVAYQAVAVFFTLLRFKPDVIVTTGAAPGFFALLFAKKLGKKTIWLDSIANVNELSLSGKMASRYADLFLTQWEHLARPDGPSYAGAVVQSSNFSTEVSADFCKASQGNKTVPPVDNQPEIQPQLVQ
jgi:UDP-N-acetylglucosamine:LPS N-acetylglucosamine transferase